MNFQVILLGYIQFVATMMMLTVGSISMVQVVHLCTIHAHNLHCSSIQYLTFWPHSSLAMSVLGPGFGHTVDRRNPANHLGWC